MTDEDRDYAKREEFPVITLCGSMRFAGLMEFVAKRLTRDGYIVLMPHVVAGRHQGDTDLKEMLDRMHLAKIDVAAMVCVVTDPTNYIGASTVAEIKYARHHGKTILWARVSEPVMTLSEADGLFLDVVCNVAA